MKADEKWFQEAYDTVVLAAGEDGLKYPGIRAAVAERYRSAIEAGELDRFAPDVLTEAASLFDSFTPKIRRARKADLVANMDWILWAVNDPEMCSAYEDSCLALAYPLGDKRDKILKLWTVEDWGLANMTRYEKARQSRAAAELFDARQKEITAQMTARGARITGDLFD